MIKHKLLLLLILMPCLWVNGQEKFDNIDKLIKHYSAVEGVVHEVKDDFELPLPFIEKLDRVESLIIEDCDPQSIADFVSIDMTSFRNYEVVFRVLDEEDIVTLLLLPMNSEGEEKFSELIFVVQEKEEGVLFRLKGIFTQPDPSMMNFAK